MHILAVLSLFSRVHISFWSYRVSFSKVCSAMSTIITDYKYRSQERDGMLRVCSVMCAQTRDQKRVLEVEIVSLPSCKHWDTSPTHNPRPQRLTHPGFKTATFQSQVNSLPTELQKQKVKPWTREEGREQTRWQGRTNMARVAVKTCTHLIHDTRPQL